MNYKIASIAGDGIGPEIVREARKVLDKIGQKYGHTFEYEELLMGGCSIDVYGESLTDETLEKAKACDSILLGAVGGNVGQSNWYQIEPSKRPEAGLLKIRKGLGLYANIRPAKSNIAVETPFHDVDMVIFRENTEDLYVGVEEQIDENTVHATKIITRKASTRIIRDAFEYAKAHDRKKVTCVHKANILNVRLPVFKHF